MEKQKFSTFYLIKRQGSFLTGLATVLNIGGNFFEYDYSESGQEADRKAIQNDWGVVGQDLEYAIGKFEKENPKLLVKS